MAGFRPEWLDLREPVDRKSYSALVLEALAEAFAGADSCCACDLGAGTGATLRGVAERLPQQQYWRLVDHDAANLEAARQRLGNWAGQPVRHGDQLVLDHGGQRLTVSFAEADLACTPDCWQARTQLVTASALFDLVSAAWLERFVSALAAARLPLLALLSYDGRLGFERQAPEDAVMIEAFNRHQRTDKGFGPAAGPAAIGILTDLLAKAGYQLVTGDSTWHLGPEYAAMRSEVLTGWAGAAHEMGVEWPVVERWLAHHADPADWLRVGHLDLFALPPAN
jgi:SAM-dependent methyltransferase